MKFPESALLTDLYQLSMLEVYWKQGMDREAAFEFFTRSIPPSRNFLIAAGLEQLLSYLEDFKFSQDEIDWLRQGGRFDNEFVDWLDKLRFTGQVYAMPEGTVFFEQEPIVRVVASLPEAQLIETRLINIIQFQSLVAAKAARAVLTAPGKQLVDFGLRRAHGVEAGLLAARAAYAAGFTGTSNVLAGLRFGIPNYGTMAHSFIEVHDDETESFRNFARVHRGPIALLIDTYDTEAAAHKVVSLAPSLKEEGIDIAAVRLDSGDIKKHAKKVRRIFDKAGLNGVHIFASGGLEELKIEKLLKSGAPIDGFGVGTHLGTSSDAPYLDCAYKLVEYDGRPRLKRSEGKATWPGQKQVYRRLAGGSFAGDVVCLEKEKQNVGARHAVPLLEPVMRNGKRLAPPESLDTIRERVAAQLKLLPKPLQGLKKTSPYPVKISKSLKELASSL